MNNPHQFASSIGTVERAMRAQFLLTRGGPDNFELRNVAEPAVQPGKLLVRIVAAAINRIDVRIREGLPIGPDLYELDKQPIEQISPLVQRQFLSGSQSTFVSGR
jgi:hypothetical protein